MDRKNHNAAISPVLVSVLFVLTCAGLRGFAQSRPLASSAPSAPPSSSVSPDTEAKGQRVVLDRVVAVINGDVILESDVQEETRFGALQPDEAEAGRNSAKTALQRLIDRDLILQQIRALQVKVVTPAQAEVDRQLTELRKEIPACAQYHCETDSGWHDFLRANGLTEPEVQAHWRQRLEILSFIQSRFGAGVRISRAEASEYYNKSFVPEFVKRKLKPPPLSAVSGRIEEILLQQRVNTFLRDWLQSLKDEGSVAILSAQYNDLGKPDPPEEDGKGDYP
ncbi:MAG TPA: peptidylprolyl isomerase [Acidobacteriaceae bacterium]|nr:peptidylprolyl isomerase [Acidobacteriaceae bacterium]